jgi:hypothetical protein
MMQPMEEVVLKNRHMSEFVLRPGTAACYLVHDATEVASEAEQASSLIADLFFLTITYSLSQPLSSSFPPYRLPSPSLPPSHFPLHLCEL